MSHSHEFKGDITRYSENISDWGNEYACSRWQDQKAGGRNECDGISQECIRPWCEKNWARQFTSYALLVTSETRGEDHRNCEWDSQEELCWHVGKAWIRKTNNPYKHREKGKQKARPTLSPLRTKNDEKTISGFWEFCRTSGQALTPEVFKICASLKSYEIQSSDIYLIPFLTEASSKEVYLCLHWPRAWII